MKKDKKNLFIFIIIIVCVIVFSYFLFFSGITEKLRASATGITANVDKDVKKEDLPVIKSVINSSGNSVVNSNVVLNVTASSIYKITKVEYSFDLKDWKKISGNFNRNNIDAKIIFTKTMDKKIYIRVTNDHGYRSYPYKTSVKIDKESPVIEIGDFESDTVIKAKDNVEISSIQCSSDKLNWEDFDVSGQEVTITKTLSSGTYLRAVDSAGNISKIKEVK
ncbi:MAG: hypothetical protein ACI4UZ_01730 [Candidatus Aphodocola sp.]